MKIGDNVKVTYTDGDENFGVIMGETAKQWKIMFDKQIEKRVSKSMKVELVKVTSPALEKQAKEDISSQSEFQKNQAVPKVVLLLAITAALIGSLVILFATGVL